MSILLIVDKSVPASMNSVVQFKALDYIFGTQIPGGSATMVAAMIFNDDLRMVSDFTTSSQEILAKLEMVVPRGILLFNLGLKKAISTFEKSIGPNRKHIICFIGSAAYVDTVALNEIVRDMRDGNITMDLIRFGHYRGCDEIFKKFIEDLNDGDNTNGKNHFILLSVQNCIDNDLGGFLPKARESSPGDETGEGSNQSASQSGSVEEEGSEEDSEESSSKDTNTDGQSKYNPFEDYADDEDQVQEQQLYRYDPLEEIRCLDLSQLNEDEEANMNINICLRYAAVEALNSHGSVFDPSLGLLHAENKVFYDHLVAKALKWLPGFPVEIADLELAVYASLSGNKVNLSG